VTGRTFYPRRFRDTRSWACEVLYGLPGLELVVDQSGGDRLPASLPSQGRRAQVFVQYHSTRAAGGRRRVHVRAWACGPLESEPFGRMRPKITSLSAALRRLVSWKLGSFLRERVYGQRKAEENAP